MNVDALVDSPLDSRTLVGVVYHGAPAKEHRCLPLSKSIRSAIRLVRHPGVRYSRVDLLYIKEEEDRLSD